MVDTESDFNRLIAPIIPYMFNGELTPVEGDASVVAKMLDMQCGIDYLLVNNGLVYGIASRIQRLKPGVIPWNTFTVRNERESESTTEFEK